MKASWLKKLRGRSAHEIWTRGRQSVSASVERVLREGRQSRPAAAALNELLVPQFAREPDAAHALLARFRQREGAQFFGAFADLSATAAAARALDPAEAESRIRRADAICDGRFDLLGYRDLSFGDPIDWQLDPITGVRAPLIHWSRIRYLDTSLVGDHKVVWELNRHQYFMTLGQAAWLTGDERYLRTCVEHLQQWMDANPPKLGINWCSSLEIAFRSISWLWALHFLRDSDVLTVPVFERMLATLCLNGRHLERYLSTYFSPNTHLTGEALGLIYLGTLLPELREAERWRAVGWKILERALPRQVYPDGVYFEQASHYQRYTADFIVHALLLEQANGGVRATPFRELLERLLVHLVHLRRPDGSMPLIGDDDGGRLAPLDERPVDDHAGVFSTGAILLSDGVLANAAGQLATETIWLLGPSARTQFASVEPAEPARASRLFPQGGYAIMRDDWSRDAGHLIVDCGPHGAMSGAHAHADALSIQLSVGGRAVLTDAGTYTYSEPDDRDRYRGSFAHNVAILDDSPPSVPSGAFAWRRTASSFIESWRSDPSFDYLEARHDGYRDLDPDVLVSRSVLALKHRYWVVRDRVRNGEAHALQLHFHCAEEVVPFADGPHLRFSRAGGDHLAAISSFPHESVATGAYAAERAWTSRCYGQRASSQHCVLRCDRQPEHDVMSFIIPERGTTVKELPIVGGRAFEILTDDDRDVLLLGEDEVMRTDDIDVAADLAWVRRDRRDGRLREIVLIGATRLAVDGVDLLLAGASVAQLSARSVDGVWTVTAPGLSSMRWTSPTSGRVA